MLPDRVSNPGPLTYESSALPITLRGPWPSMQAENLLVQIRWLIITPVPRDNQRDREQQTLLKSISSHRDQFAMDQFDPWQVVPRQVFTPYIFPPVDFNWVSCQSCWLSRDIQCDYELPCLEIH